MLEKRDPVQRFQKFQEVSLLDFLRKEIYSYLSIPADRKVAILHYLAKEVENELKEVEMEVVVKMKGPKRYLEEAMRKVRHAVGKWSAGA